MSLFKRLFGNEPEPEGEAHGLPEPTEEQHLTAIGPDELAKLESSAARSLSLPVSEKASAMASELMPLAANAAQAAQEYSMAIVKFPEGVTWADLCVRKSDGWNLLSNFKNGHFNDMAGIKQAGLQPVAIANLALQGAAVVVGQAYMTQINDKLEGIQSGIEEIQRAMDRERDANLKSAYDALARHALKFEEYGASPEKRQVALQAIEDATNEATKAWNYQLNAIRDLAANLKGKKRLKTAEIEAETRKLASMESRATAAFQLVLAALQLGMRLESDYTAKRIETDRRIAAQMADEYRVARGDAQQQLSRKIAKTRGALILLADKADDGYERANPAKDALHAVTSNASRLNPARMRQKAEDALREKKALLQDRVSTENGVSALEDSYESELDDLDFAFNQADAVVIENNKIKLISTKKAASDSEPEE